MDYSKAILFASVSLSSGPGLLLSVSATALQYYVVKKLDLD
jgi:hypothetical protein